MSIDRDALLKHLEALGDPDDATALAAARAAQAMVEGGGLGWDDVLVPDNDAVAEFDLDDEDHENELDEADEEDEDAAETAEPADDDDADEAPPADADLAEAQAIIKELLARKNLFEATREELQDYKQDLADGNLHPADVRYLRALKKRLSK